MRERGNPRPKGVTLGPTTFFQSRHARVAGAEGRKAAEITVGRPQLRHAVSEADRRDPGVVNPRPGDLGLRHKLPQDRPVSRPLGDQSGGGRFKQRIDHIIFYRFIKMVRLQSLKPRGIKTVT